MERVRVSSLSVHEEAQQQGDVKGTHAQSIPQHRCLQVNVGDVHQSQGGIEDKSQKTQDIHKRITASKMSVRADHDWNLEPFRKPLPTQLHTREQLDQIFRRLKMCSLSRSQSMVSGPSVQLRDNHTKLTRP